MTNDVAGRFAGAATSVDPERITFEAMQDGWVAQQRSRQQPSSKPSSPALLGLDRPRSADTGGPEDLPGVRHERGLRVGQPVQG